MTMSPVPLGDADLHAYVDGQAEPERIPAIETALRDDPALAERVAGLRRQNAALRDALDPLLSEPIPQRLLDAAARPPARWRRMLPALGAAALLGVGCGIGWLARDAVLERAGTPTTFAKQAALTHALYASDVNRPVEIWAAEEKRLVTWLSRRLGFPVHAPDLNGFGYALVGGRLVAGNEKPTALFMYENADKQRLTLQVRKQASGATDTAFRYTIEDGVGVFYWIDDKCGYALSGQLDRGQLLAMSRLVYGQLAAADSVPR
jgi:anti-sigma factor RsiW